MAIGYFGLHSTPVQPPFYGLQQPLTALKSLTDEAGIICVLEKVDGSPRSLTDEAGIICVLEKVGGSPRSLTDEAGNICILEKVGGSLTA